MVSAKNAKQDCSKKTAAKTTTKNQWFKTIYADITSFKN